MLLIPMTNNRNFCGMSFLTFICFWWIAAAEICDEDSSLGEYCDVGTCCFKDDIWYCAISDADRVGCQNPKHTPEWVIFVVIICVIGFSVLAVWFAYWIRRRRMNQAADRRILVLSDGAGYPG